MFALALARLLAFTPKTKTNSLAQPGCAHPLSLADRNEALASLGEAFHSLTSVGGHLIFAGNLRLVRAPSAAFARMTHIGEYIEWYGQGGLNTGTNSAWGDHDRGCCSNFCDSIRAQLCTVHPNPHGTNGWRDNGDGFDADSCCVAYCANRWSGNRCVN